jgi:hypothetical protein
MESATKIGIGALIAVFACVLAYAELRADVALNTGASAAELTLATFTDAR